MLVVEDEYLSKQLMGLIIARYGSFDSADDGAQALRAVKLAREEGRPYDLIFLDIVLPTMDGLTVLSEIRSHEASLGAMGASKVIMVSALSDGETQRESRDHQCDAYMTKPFSKSMLESTIGKLFNN